MAIGSLAVRISSDTTNFNKGVSSASGRAKKLGREFSSLGKQAATMTAAIVAAGAAIAASLTVKGLAAVDAQAKLARQIGGTIDGLRALQIAGSDAGVETATLNKALDRLNGRLGEAQQGSGEAYDALQRLGLSAKELGEMDVDERMATIADRMKDMGLSTQVAADELRNLGIRQGEVTNLMLQGGDAIRNAKQEVDDLGLSLSNIDAKKVEIANDAFARTGLLVEAVQQQLAVSSAPYLTAISNMMVDAAKDAGGLKEATASAFDLIIEGAADAVNAVARLDNQFLRTKAALDIFALEIRNGFLEIAREIVEIPTGAVNELIKMLNLVGGDIELLGLSQMGQGVQDVIDSTSEEIAGINDRLAEELSKPLPGDLFKRYASEAKEAAEIAARTSEGIKSFFGQDQEGSSMIDSILGNADQWWERYGELTEFQEETDEEQLERRQKLFDRMQALEDRAQDKRIQAAQQKARLREDVEADMWNSLTSLMNSGSRKLFEIGKASAIAESIMSTYKGATKALELGWPLGPVAAAAITTAGFANVARIKSQSFGGGSSGGGTAPTAQLNEAQQGTQQQQRSTNIDISLIGGNDRDRAVGSSIIEQINEEVERGGRINRVALV